MTRRLPAVTVPVFFYVVVTLGVPVVRGAALHPEFLPHATTLLLIVTVVSAAWTYLPRVASRAIGRVWRSPPSGLTVPGGRAVRFPTLPRAARTPTRRLAGP